MVEIVEINKLKKDKIKLDLYSFLFVYLGTK